MITSNNNNLENSNNGEIDCSLLEGELDRFYFSKGNFRRPLPKKLFIPTETQNDDSQVKGILISLQIGGIKVIRHLVWKLLFRGISTLEWYILFEFLTRNQKEADLISNVCLTGVLFESSKTRKRLENLDSQMRPIHKKMSARTLRKEFRIFTKNNTLLEFLIHHLDVPERGLSKNSLYLSKFVTSEFPKPKEPQILGQGYKDKGSLGPDNVIVHSEEIIQPHNSFQEQSFLLHWKDILRLFVD